METLNANTQQNLSASSTLQIPRMLSRMLSREQVIHYTGLGKSTIYDMLNKKSSRYDSSFPTQVKLSEGRVAWVESEIAHWLEGKMANRFK